MCLNHDLEVSELSAGKGAMQATIPWLIMDFIYIVCIAFSGEGKLGGEINVQQLLNWPVVLKLSLNYR